MATLTASGVNDQDELLDYRWLKNCEMMAFTNY